MDRKAKVGLWVLALAVIAALFAFTASRRLRKEEVQSIEAMQKDEGVPVDVVESRVLPIEDWRRFVGTSEGFDQIDLVADARSRVNRVHVGIGDEVARGDVLVSLDRFDPARSELNLESASARYDAARKDSVRMEELLRSGAVAQQQLDHVKAECDAARASYRAARRAVELDTPIPGVVTALYVEPGAYADKGGVIATVASYDRIRIRLDLAESERALVDKGLPARLRIDENDPTGLLEGTVIRADLSANAVTRLYRVELEIENPDHRLKPGGLVAPEILVASDSENPVIPETAIVRLRGADQVYVITGSGDDLRVKLRDLRPGVESASLLSTLSGVTAGEKVVVWGQNKLQDGVKVRIHSDLTSRLLGDAK